MRRFGLILLALLFCTTPTVAEQTAMDQLAFMPENFPPSKQRFTT